MKRIYFAVPLQKNRDNNLAKNIFQILKEFGSEIVSKWILWDDPNPNLDPVGVYKRDSKAIQSCDILIAEVSNPSIGVGMEIMFAKTLGKKIICIHKEPGISNFLSGMPGIIIISYLNLEDLARKLRTVII